MLVCLREDFDMKVFILTLLLPLNVWAQSQSSDARAPESKQEQEAIQEWNQEEEEARERAERERWILEERARGYEPTSKRYKPVMPRKRAP